MLLKKKIILLVAFIIIFLNAPNSQDDTSKVYAYAWKADSMYKRKAYDSALVVYLAGYELIKKHKLFEEPISCIVISGIGNCYNEKDNAGKAHQYYNLWLQITRTFNYVYEKEQSLTALAELHRKILEKNLPFNYPPVTTTEKALITLPLGPMKNMGDSIEITLMGGRYDGISDSTLSGEVYTSINDADSLHHNSIEFYGLARIVRLENNRTIVRVKNKPAIKLLKTDFAFIDAYVPLQWNRLSLRSFLIRSISLRNNYREQLYNYRYFYYYNDSLLEKETLQLIRAAITDIAKEFAPDTLTVEAYRQPAVAGIFTGKNVIRSMLDSKPEHIKLFLNFVNRFPAKYINHNHKVAETYATWIINKTPFDPPDVKPYLTGIVSQQDRRRQAFNLRQQIKDDGLIDKWLDDGMQQTNIENITEANKTAVLLTDVLTATNDNYNKGWGNFLFASIEKRMSNDKLADSILMQSKEIFKEAGNKEGESWANSTAAQWKKGSKINVGVQNGHLFPFVITESANTRYFATGGKDNLIKIWDRNLNKEIVTLKEHTAEINSLHYSPNGRYLVSASEDSSLCIWNAYNYTLLHKFKTQGIVRSAKFSPDNKLIVTAGEDSIIRFRNAETGTVVKQLALHTGRVYDIAFNPVSPTRLFSCGADSMVYKWDLETNEMIHWYRQKGKVLTISLSNDGRYLSLISTDSAFAIWNVETNKKPYYGKIHTYQPGAYTNYSTGSFSADSKYFIYPKARDSFNVVDLNNYYERIYSTQLTYNLSDMVFSKDGNSLFARFNYGPLRIYNFAGWDIRNSPTLSFNDIKTYANLAVGVQFTNDDNNLVMLHSEVGMLDLRNGNYKHLFLGGSVIESPALLLRNENLGVFIEFNEAALVFYDYKNKTVTQKFSLPPGEKVSSYEISPDNLYAFIGSEKGLITAWNTKNNKQLFSNNYSSGADLKIIKLKYDEHHKRLFAISEAGTVFIINPQTGDTTASIRDQKATYTAVTPQFVYVTSENGYLYKHDAVSLKALKRILLNKDHTGIYQPVISHNLKYLLLRNVITDLTAIQISNDSILYQIPDHEFSGSSIGISHDNKMVATAGFGSEVNVFELATGKRIVTVHLPMNKGVLITDTSGNYLSPKNTLEAIQFTYNNNAYTFDQFDVQFNRPDLVLKKIGKADTALLKMYSTAWKKRLSRLKINENDLGSEIHLPLVRLQDKFAVQPVTTQKEYELTVECSDSRYPLKSLQVLVNNSPLLGVSGKDLIPFQTQHTIQKITIPLSDGNNNIKVYCVNSKGAISLKESFDIISKYKPEQKAKVYFVGIAVANYKDSRMNLGYSVKDVRDLAKTFDNLYSNISIDTLIDLKATKENILAVKTRLMQTTVNDRVILAVTGHGLLSDSLDFYYATWDTDFQKPEKRGLRYEDLENLLTDIPARQKLMLIDACHSGALDKEELLALKNDSTSSTVITRDKQKSVKGRASRGLIVKNKEAKMSANSSFEMMQNLFSDLSSSNGAVIISAAGGMEYAFESGKWNNGVFTYCVRKGIEERKADSEGGNNDTKVSVQELLNYVSRKVSELTNDKQKPTSRRENIDYEWMIRN